jgi:hypothetical protein
MFGPYCNNLNVKNCTVSLNTLGNITNSQDIGGMFGPYCNNINAYYCKITNLTFNNNSNFGGIFGSGCYNINAYYCSTTANITIDSAYVFNSIFGNYCYNINAYYCYSTITSITNANSYAVIFGDNCNFYCYYCYIDVITNNYTKICSDNCIGYIYYSYVNGNNLSNYIMGDNSAGSINNCYLVSNADDYINSGSVTVINSLIVTSWSDSNANSILSSGTDTVPSSLNNYGFIWASTAGYNTNTPYVLSGYYLPVIQSVSPNSGLNNGTIEAIIITGFNFTNYPITSIYFGSYECNSFTIIDNNTIYISPPDVGVNLTILTLSVNINNQYGTGSNFNYSVPYLPLYFIFNAAFPFVSSNGDYVGANITLF